MTVQQIGDWVRVDSKGFWSIQRAVPAHYEPRYSLSDRKVYESEAGKLRKQLSVAGQSAASSGVSLPPEFTHILKSSEK